jgi:hypothetical protein
MWYHTSSKLVTQTGPDLMVTFNKKHFQKLAETSRETGVIAITHALPPKQRDAKLTAFLRKRTLGELFGAMHVITGETQTADEPEAL